MKASQIKEKQTNKPNFLERFSGKLNIITKHGEIQQKNILKLPSLPFYQQKRNSTINLKMTNQIFPRLSSEYNQNSTIKYAISILRAQKGSKQHQPILNEIPNNFIKNQSKKLLKTTKEKLKTFEPLTSLFFSRKSAQNFNLQNQILNPYSIKSVNGRNNDYLDFLNELDMIRDKGKGKIR